MSPSTASASNTVVFAHLGDLNTSCIIPWLIELCGSAVYDDFNVAAQRDRRLNKEILEVMR